jgi:hypothetical protein
MTGIRTAGRSGARIHEPTGLWGLRRPLTNRVDKLIKVLGYGRPASLAPYDGGDTWNQFLLQ